MTDVSVSGGGCEVKREEREKSADVCTCVREGKGERSTRLREYATPWQARNIQRSEVVAIDEIHNDFTDSIFLGRFAFCDKKGQCDKSIVGKAFAAVLAI